jgi:hypothetical protein
MTLEYTPAIINNGGAHPIKMVENETTITETARWVGTYKVGADHAVYTSMGIGDREFEVKGGPINATEYGYIKTALEGATTVTFRCSLTANADVTMIILSCAMKYTSFISGAVSVQGKANVDGVTGRVIHVLLKLREVT